MQRSQLLILALFAASCARSPSRSLVGDSEPLERPLSTEHDSAAPAASSSGWDPFRGPPPAAREPIASSARLSDPVTDRTAVAQAPSLHRQLRETRVPGYHLDDEGSLRAALAPLAQLADVPIYVTPAAERAVDDAGIRFDLNLASSRSVRSVLNLVVELAEGEVDWTVRHGVVYVTTSADARELVLRRYDLRGLTAGIVSTTPPPIGQVGVSGYEPDEEFNTRERVEPTVSADRIVSLIQDNVDPESWDEDGSSLRLVGGILFVRNTPEVQARVQSLLSQFGI